MVAGCGSSLPDPDSPGAHVYVERCGGCHRLSAPGTMTIAMWRFQVDRMRDEYARRGRPWLTPDEERTLLDWLARQAEGRG